MLRIKVKGEGEVVGRLERCAGGWQFDIPVLYGRGRVAVRRQRNVANVKVLPIPVPNVNAVLYSSPILSK